MKKTGSSGKFDRKLNPVIREVQPCVQESTSWCSEYYSATGCRTVLVYIYTWSVRVRKHIWGTMVPGHQTCISYIPGVYVSKLHIPKVYIPNIYTYKLHIPNIYILNIHTCKLHIPNIYIHVSVYVHLRYAIP
jgi:hypothetical protein